MSSFATELSKFLEDHQIGVVAAARALGASRVTVYNWLNQRAYPDETYRAAIEKWTGGRVRVPSKDDTSKVRAIRTFRPPKKNRKLAH